MEGCGSYDRIPGFGPMLAVIRRLMLDAHRRARHGTASTGTTLPLFAHQT